MKQVKAPEKKEKKKETFADVIKSKNEKKKTEVNLTEEYFPGLGEVVEPKPKEEVKPTPVEEYINILIYLFILKKFVVKKQSDQENLLIIIKKKKIICKNQLRRYLKQLFQS